SQRQYKAGYARYLTLLSAEQGYQQARITLVQAQASRYADTAALFQAMGGGWGDPQDLAAGKKYEKNRALAAPAALSTPISARNRTRGSGNDYSYRSQRLQPQGGQQPGEVLWEQSA